MSYHATDQETEHHLRSLSRPSSPVSVTDGQGGRTDGQPPVNSVSTFCAEPITQLSSAGELPLSTPLGQKERGGERRQRLHASQLYAPPIFLSVVKGAKYFWHLRHSEILLRTAHGGKVWDQGVYLQRAKEFHKLGRRVHLYLMSFRWVGRPGNPRRRHGSATWAGRQCRENGELFTGSDGWKLHVQKPLRRQMDSISHRKLFTW